MDSGPFHVPIAFHRDILHEFATESGLLVLARGLGLETVINSFCHLYADKRLLVFLLSAVSVDAAEDDAEANVAGAETWESSQHIQTIRPEMSIKERQRRYSHGGVVILSARVFLMDMLMSRIPAALVSGVMIKHAHRVTEHGMIAFGLHLLRANNPTAFIKAFSDNPEGLIRGFAKSEKIMKSLRISNLVLYPRFHVKVNDELSRARMKIYEIESALTQRMKMIQFAIMGILETSMNDICKDNSLDMSDFNASLSVFTEFDSIIQQHLESNWHHVGFKTRQLLTELKTLRAILAMSMELDSVSFQQYLQIQVRAAQGVRYQSSAYWLFAESANVLLEVAKERALARESNPKWAAFLAVLAEVESERKVPQHPILVVVASREAISRLSAIISLGADEYLNCMHRAFSPEQGVGSKRPHEESSEMEGLKELLNFKLFAEILAARNIIVKSADDISLEALKSLNPTALLFYQPQLELIRTVEIFKCSGDDSSLPVYFFMYKDSVEEQKYLTSIRREKEAFEQLIKTKSTMLPYNEEASVETEALIEDTLMKSHRTTTIPAQDAEFPRKIVVDTRDLRSSLPFLLHLYGFEIQPVTIAVGDYLLSPTMVVERKSLPDLISSLNSGRLLSQVQAMSRKYATFMLLIEFDADKPFYLLQSRGASALRRADISPNDVISKLALLILHFPKLKLLWTSSPKATCEIFHDLKRNELNPDLSESSIVEGASLYNDKPKVQCAAIAA